MADLSNEKAPLQKQAEPVTPVGTDKGPEEPNFDKWDLSEPVRALLLELVKTEDKTRIEAIINELTTDHKVPKDLIKEVLTSDQGFWANTWDLIKTGSWHESSLDEDGNVKTTFKLDSKGIGWETENMAVGFDLSKTKAYYKDKDDKWSVEAGAADGGGFVGTAIGDKETGLHEGKLYGSGGKDKLKLGGEYSYTEGENKYSGGAEYKQEGGTHTISGKYSETEGSVTEEVSGELYLGNTEGMSGTYHYKDTKAKEGEKPKPGDLVDVTISGTTKVEKDAEQPDSEKTTLALKTGVQAGNTDVSVGYNQVGDKVEGKSFHVTSLDVKAGQNIELGKDETLRLVAGGNITVDEHEDKENTFNLSTSATLSSGTGKDKESVTFTLAGGKTTAGGVAGQVGMEPGLIGDPEGYGGYGKLGISKTADGKTIGGEISVGTIGEMELAGAKAYLKSKELNFDILGSVARQDEQLTSLLQATTSIALNNKLSLTGGGKIAFKPGESGYDELWQAYAGVGINLGKGMDLNLKMGVASDGTQIAYIPEASFELDKKFKITALASFAEGSRPSVGAKLDIGKSAFSVLGGVGDPSLLSSPHMGSSGLSMPGMDSKDVMGWGSQSNGYIMVQCDLLKLGRQIFGK